MLEKLPVSFGEALHQQRAGLEQVVFMRLKQPSNLVPMDVSSSVIKEGSLPVRYTADGEGISPPLEWRGAPQETSFVVVIVEDADSPTPHPLVHAIVVNLDPRESSMPEGALNSRDHSGLGLPTGPNSFLSHSWLPPDPPPGHGIHRYVFQVFALRGPLFGSAPGRGELHTAIDERAIGAGYVIGTYERTQPEKTLEPVTLGLGSTPLQEA